MAVLSLLSDLKTIEGQAPLEFKLSTEKVIIGRGSLAVRVDMFISAKNNGKEIISRKHAEIHLQNIPSDFVITDLGALNGLFVNGVRVNRQRLKHGDVIQFGGAAKVPFGTILTVSDTCIKYKYICLEQNCNGSPMCNKTVEGVGHSSSNQLSTNFQGHQP